jgi:hypothetical protein
MRCDVKPHERRVKPEKQMIWIEYFAARPFKASASQSKPVFQFFWPGALGRAHLLKRKNRITTMASRVSLRIIFLAILALLLPALVCVCSAQAQSVLGGIHGVTRDPGGILPVEQAQATLLNSEGIADRIVLSEADGTFAMENLAPGRYAILFF